MDEPTWFDHAWTGAPLATHDPDLAHAISECYGTLLSRFAGLGPRWKAEIEASLRIELRSDGDEDGPAVRCHAARSDTWHDLWDWDGSPRQLEEFVDYAAIIDAGWIFDDRRIAGPTGWDA